VALVVALALIFAGRFVIRVVAFFGVGIAFASAFAAFGAVILGGVGLVLGGIVGFFVGAILSFFLLPLAIGIATGLLAYKLMQALFHIYVLSVIIGVVLFIVGLALSMKLLALAAVIFGSLLLFDVLVYFHFPALIAILVAGLIGVIGFWAQDGFESKGQQGYKFSSWSRAAPPPTAVPVNPKSSSGGVRYCAYCGSRIENPEAQFCPNCGAPVSG
jgi:zinc-ribbon domain